MMVHIKKKKSVKKNREFQDYQGRTLNQAWSPLKRTDHTTMKLRFVSVKGSEPLK